MEVTHFFHSNKQGDWGQSHTISLAKLNAAAKVNCDAISHRGGFRSATQPARPHHPRSHSPRQQTRHRRCRPDRHHQTPRHRHLCRPPRHHTRHRRCRPDHHHHHRQTPHHRRLCRPP